MTTSTVLPNGFVSTSEAARLTALHPSSIVRATRNGVPHEKRDGRLYVDLDSLRVRMAQDHRHQPRKKRGPSRRVTAPNGLVPTSQAAEALGMNISYVGRLVRQHDIAGKKIGKRVYVDLDALRAYQQASAKRPQSTPELRDLARKIRVEAMRQRQAAPTPAAHVGPFARIEQRLDRLEQQLGDLLRLFQ